ncbi:MAG TPA: hypothetical protein VJH94_00790 [Candidatus Paceibacterota bacterium]
MSRNDGRLVDKREHAFYALLKAHLPQFNFGVEIEGNHLFLTYYGEYYYAVLEYTGNPPREDRGVWDIPRLARYEIGERQASELQVVELQTLRGMASKAVASVQTQVEAQKQIVRDRVAEGERNRKAKPCEHCEDMNSIPRRRPNGTDAPFTCTCGIRYVYDRQLRWWNRETCAESQHRHEELMYVLQYGEPDY